MQDLFKLKVYLFLLILLIYLLFASGHPWIEADNQLQIAKELIHHASLSTSGNIRKEDADVKIMGRNGRWYDTHGITNVLLMTPVASLELFLDSKNKNIEKFISFLGALTGVLVNASVSVVFFSILLLMHRPLATCYHTTICLSFLTIVFPYSSNNYEGNLLMLFILGSIYFLFAYREKNLLRYLTYSGALAGLAINTREFSWIFFFCVVAYLFWFSLKEKRIRLLVMFFSATIPFFILWGYYNFLRTGVVYLTPITAGILSGRWSHFAPSSNIFHGLRGLIFSPGASIFIYSPVFVLSILGWGNFFRNKREECLFILSIIILFLLAIAKMPKWYGLWCWGPRYTLEITPLIMLPLAFWLPISIKSKIKKTSFIVVCLFSLLIQLAAALTNWHSRLGYYLDEYGESALFFTFKYSQWWDGIKTLFINFFNLFFGKLYYFENPGFHPDISDASLYMSKTIFTWWNRLFYQGFPPQVILGYLVVSLVLCNI